jgi:hypothetical protein
MFGWSEMIEVYLVETRSMGGLSGSPVFVRTDDHRRSGNSAERFAYYFLGLVHGHFESYARLQSGATVEESQSHPEVELLNMGISMVVPASYVRDILDRPEWVRERAVMAARLQSGETVESVASQP